MQDKLVRYSPICKSLQALPRFFRFSPSRTLVIERGGL
nr:MAG TPA: hypothetical protein [Caudoviricetes sp.]